MAFTGPSFRKLCLLAALACLASCSVNDPLNTPEVSENDAYVRRQDPQVLLAKMAAMADEPYILGGEQAENLILQIRSLIKISGDRAFAREFRKLSPRQQSAARLFVTSESLGISSGNLMATRYPLTARCIADSPKVDNWAALEAERKATGEVQFARDRWP